MVMVIVVTVCMVIIAVSVNYSHLAVIVWSLNGHCVVIAWWSSCRHCGHCVATG